MNSELRGFTSLVSKFAPGITSPPPKDWDCKREAVPLRH